MKIMHYVHTPRASGAEKLVADLLMLHKEKNISCALAAMFPMEGSYELISNKLKNAGIEIYFPVMSPSRFGRVSNLRNYVKKFNPSVVFAHSVLPSAYARISGIGVPVVNVLHSEDDYRSGILKYSEYVLRHFSDYTITVSERAKINYIKRYGNNNCSTIINGIDLSVVEDNELRRECIRDELHKMHGGKYFLLQVGRINNVKNQARSVELVKELKNRGFDVNLLMAGLPEDKNYLSTIMKLADSLKISDNIIYLGSRDDVYNLLGACDCYLMPSRQEAHSVAMLEALASGIGIVASDINSFKFADKYEGVFLVNNEEDISVLANSVEKIFKADGYRYKRDMKNFCIKDTAACYEKISNQFLNK